MLKFNLSRGIKKIMVTTLVSIIVAISSYMVMYVNNFKQYEEEISNKLFMIGKEQRDSIVRLLTEIEEEILFISNINGIKFMDPKEIVRISSYLMATKSRYKRLVAMDVKGKIIYGYVEKPEAIYESSYFEKAISTKEISSEMAKNPNGYAVRMYCPILDYQNNVAGMLFLDMGISEISNILKSTKSEEGMESYLINKEGVMITESKFLPDAIGRVKMNIKNIKINIDHSRTNRYDDYRGDKVYGRYFPIEGTDWTLIIESDYNYSKMKQEKTKTIGQITVAMQGLFVFLIQLYCKKRFGVDIADNIKEFENSNDRKSVINEVIEKIIESEEEEKDDKKNKKENSSPS